jgi:HEAT repeat protein
MSDPPNAHNAALALSLVITLMAMSPADTALASQVPEAPPDVRTTQEVLDSILTVAEHAPGTAAILMHVVEDPSQRLVVRASAIGALSCGSFREAVPTLVRLVLDTNEDVGLRIQGLGGLRALRDPRGVEAAAKLADDPDPGIRAAAYFALSSTPTKESRDALVSRLPLDRSATRLSLIWAIFNFGGPRTGIGSSLLENWTADETDPNLLHAYLSALTEYRVCSAGPRVAPLLHHEDGLARLLATQYFAACPDRDAADNLIYMLLDDWRRWDFAWETASAVRQFAVNALITDRQRSPLEAALEDFATVARRHVRWVNPNARTKEEILKWERENQERRTRTSDGVGVTP